MRVTSLKKWTAVLLAAFMCLSLLPVNMAFASEVTAITISPSQLIIHANYSGEILLSYSCTGSGDSSGIVFNSSNEDVATVDNNGYITLVAEGSTVITASLGSVTSNECSVTVTAAEDYTGNNQLNLPASTTSRIDIDQYLSWPENYGDAQVALWKDNKTGAFSFTADDCITGDFPAWNQWREDYGISVTFFTPIVNAFDKEANKAALQEQVNLGHDVQSHTQYHRTGDEQTAQTSAERIDELNTSKLAINELENHKSKTIGYAYGFYDPEMAKNFYIAGRTGVGFLNTADKVDYMEVNSLSMTPTMPLRYVKANSASMEGSVGALLDPEYKFWNTSYYGGWTNTHSHALASSKQTHSELGENTTANDVWSFVFKNYIMPNKDRLYLDNFTNVAMYGQERDSASVTVTEASADTIRFNITDTLSDEYFDFPLTIKVKLDSAWNKLSATQNGSAVEAKLVCDSGNVYAMVEAVPDRGEVVLQKSGEEKIFSSNTKLASLTYGTDGISDSAVPGFSADDEGAEYTVALPAGTVDAYVYASSADEAAVVSVNPMMSRVDVSGGSGAAQVTVTAEDGSADTYTVNFTVEGYETITALEINTPDNLSQVDAAQTVNFSVVTTPAENVREESVEWYVNDVKQDGKTGTSFEFIPPAAGSYNIYARAGDAVSETRTVSLILTGAVVDKVFLADKFNSEGYSVDSKVPNGADYIWLTGNNNFVVGTDPVHGNIGVFKAAETAQNIMVNTTIDSENKPVVFSAKVKMDSQITTGHSFSMMFRPPSGSAVSVGGLGGNAYRQTTVGSSWGKPTWVAGEWINLIAYLKPNSADMTACDVTLYIGGTFEGGTTAEQAAKFAKKSATVNMSAFDMSAINTMIRVDIPANGYNVSVADVRIYQPNSFIMSLDKTQEVTAEEPLTVRFNHHMDLTTFSADLVTVSADGEAAELESVTVDPLYPDHMIITFAPDTLKAGTEYTVSLDSAVKDVGGNAVYEPKSFTTAGDVAVKPKLSGLSYKEDDKAFKSVTGFSESDNSKTYSVILSNGTTSAAVSAASADENAQIAYSPESGTVDVSGGSGSVSVTVKDKTTGAENVYTVNFEVTSETAQTNVIIPDEYNTGYSGRYDELLDITEKYPSLQKGSDGSVRISESGTYEGFKSEGSGLYITAENVVLKDFYIDANLGSGIDFRGTSLTAERGVITNASNGVVSSTSTTLKGLHIYDVTDDCIKVEKDAVIEGCYLHHAGKGDSTAHADGIQVSGGDGSGNIKILNNRIDIQGVPNSYYATSALMIKADMGDISDVTIEGNVLNGGTYTVYLLDAAYALKEAILKNNLMASGAAYGNLSADYTSGQIYNNIVIEDVLSGSIFMADENGAVIEKLSDAKGKTVAFGANLSNYALAEKQGTVTVELIKNEVAEVSNTENFTLPTYTPYDEYKDTDGSAYAQPVDVLQSVSMDIPADLSGYSVRVSVLSGSTLIAQKVFEVDTQAPEAPSELTAESITKTGAVVSWKAAVDNVGVVGYKVYLNDTLAATVTEGLAYELSELTEKTAYTVEVIAFDLEGNESAAASVSFETKGDVEYEYELLFEDNFEEYDIGVISGTSGDNPLKTGWYSAGGAGDWSVTLDGTNQAAKVSPYSQAYPSMWKVVPIEVGKPVVFSGRALLHQSNSFYMRPRYIAGSGVGTAIDGFSLFANGEVSLYGAGKYKGEEKILEDKWINFEFYILPGDVGEETLMQITLSGDGVVDAGGEPAVITMSHSAVIDQVGMATNKQVLMIYNNNFPETGSSATSYNLLDDVKIYTPESEKEAQTATISVTVTGGGYAMVNGENKGAAFTGDFNVGDKIEAEAAAGENESFMFWKDLSSGRVLTYDTVYEFSVGTDRSIAAVTVDNTSEAKFISFTSANGAVLFAGYQSEDIKVPENPYIYGYTFDGWYAGGVKQQLSAGDAVPQADVNTQYRAGFKEAAATYTIVAVGANEQGGTYSYNDKVTFTANPGANQTFTYWKKNELIVSYDTSYSFYVNEDADIEAVYNETADSEILLVMSTPTLVAGNKIAFFSERNISDEYSLIETGILLSDKAGVSLESYSHKATSVYNTSVGQFTVRKANVEAGHTWYGVAYAIYRDANGSVVTEYSNEVSYAVE